MHLHIMQSKSSTLISNENICDNYVLDICIIRYNQENESIRANARSTRYTSRREITLPFPLKLASR